MSKKFVIVHGLVGLLDPLTIDCISRIKNLNEQMLLLFFEQQQLFSDANQIRNYLIRNSLSVCSSLLGLNRKTSFSPVQRVYSCTEETAECSVQCVQCVQGTNTRTKCHRQLRREHRPVRSGQQYTLCDPGCEYYSDIVMGV